MRTPVRKDVWFWMATALTLWFGIETIVNPPPSTVDSPVGTAIGGGIFLWLLVMAPRRLGYVLRDAIRVMSKTRGKSLSPKESVIMPPEREIVLPSTTNSDVMIVFGRNVDARNALADFLRALGLNPLQWTELIGDTAQGRP